MNRRRFVLAAAAGALTGFARRLWPKPPVTARIPRRIVQLGRVRIDPYAWLKPANWKAVWRNPALLPLAIRDHLQAENAYCAAVLSPTQPLQAKLAAEIERLDALSAPPPPRIDGHWAYETRFATGAQQPSFWRRPVSGGPAVLLLDGPARAAGHAYFRIVSAGPSPDHRLFAWAEDVAGAEKYRIWIKDLASGRLIEGPADAFGDFAISPDGHWLFWTWRSPESRPARVFRRPVAGGADALVREETDPAFFMTVRLSGSQRFIFIRAFNDVTGEVWLIDMNRPSGPARVVEPRRKALFYDVDDWNGRLVVRTNADGAGDFKLMLAPAAAPQRANWREWVPCQPGRTITHARAFARHVVRVERVEGDARLVVAAPDESWAAPIGFDEAAYVVRLQPSDYHGSTQSFSYESPRTPRRWVALDLASGERTIVSATKADQPSLALYRLHARAGDGAEVPITVLHLADLVPDGSQPLMLTGYGAYGESYETVYAPENVALVERGWIWAAAHVRGGSEKGVAWFEAARRLKERTSFNDFIACAEALIGSRRGAAGRIVGFGYSAGGLLVGAVLNMRPDLFAGVVGRAPFVDVLNTMSDASHPLVPLTRPVWGDPLASTADYDNIASYSPYDNVRSQAYPPVLATTAVADDRVGFWEPAKWIAKLRACSTSAAPMLLHAEMAGGHAGAGGRSALAVQLARMYAFAIWAAHWPGRDGE